jgi:PAS domain S-box-containing protein
MTFWPLAGILAQPIPRPFRSLLLASVLVPTVILILAAALDRDHLIEVAKEEARKTVAVLHEHTVKVMDTLELALAQIQDRSRGLSWGEIAAAEDLFQDLRRLVERLPQVDAAFLVRPDGENVMTSRVFPSPPINFADRDYFRAQADTDAGLFISKTYLGKISGHPIFNVSQRRQGGQAGFDGVVGLSVSTDYFSRFYQSVAEYDGAAIALARTDGAILVRYPTLDKEVMRFAPDGPAMTGLARGQEHWTAIGTSSQDGEERIFALRKLQAYPLLVVYGIPMRLVTQRWLNNLTAYAGFAALAAASLAAATLFALARVRVDERAAEVLRTHEAEFRASFELGAVGKVQADPETGRFLRVNDTFCRMTGYSRDELLGLAFTDITHPDDLEGDLDQYRRLLSGEISSYRREKRHRRKDGSVAWVLVAATTLRDPHGRALRVLGDILDITGDKLAAERLRESEAAQRAAKEVAERATLAKSKFLAAASHDLRQPLQALILFTAMLNGHVQSPRGRQALAHLERGLDTLKALLDSLLDISKLDAGMVQPEITAFPIDALLDEIAASYASMAANKGLDWRVEPGATTVRSDRTLLGRLLRNLVENALRYTQQGSIRITCRRVEDRLRLAVEDTGIGIPPEHLERIFEEFHQVGNVARDRTQGLGLGLAIVRRLADLLGYRIGVRSHPGAGSTFSIELPLGTEEPTHPSVPEAACPGQDGRGRLAVVVDDDTLVLDSLQALLTEWGYEVLTATDADQTVARIRERSHRPDIVLADYRLRDGRTGIEAIRAVRALFDHPIPGVILTGETDLAFLPTAAGHDVGIAHKPVTPHQLGRVLAQQLQAAA